MQFESDKSAFNFAVAYLLSINNSLEICKAMAYAEDVGGWIKSLRAVYRELSLMTNKEEDEGIDKDFKEIYSLFNNDEQRENKNLILSKLDLLEIKLRKTLQSKNMVLPKTSDPRFAILER